MRLDLDDADLFFKLHRTLMCFVNERKGILANPGGSPEIYATFSPRDRMTVHQAFLEDRGPLIDAFVSANPAGLDDEQLAEIRSWKQAVAGKFFIFRQLKKHMIFVDAGRSPTVYGVVALTEPFEDLLGNRLPILASTTLLPFRGMIVYDGVIVSQAVTFGSGIKTSLNDAYRRAKAGRGVFVSLAAPPPASAKTKPPTRKERVKQLAAKLRRRINDIRKRREEINEFQGTVIPAFDRWLETTLAHERTIHRKLVTEVEELEGALDAMQMGLSLGQFSSPEAAAKTVLANLKKEREAASAAEFGSAPDDGPGSDGPDEDEDEDDFDEDDAEDIPEELLDFLFASFMRDVRRTDIRDMDGARYAEERAKFAESFTHASNDNRASFEELLSGVGADRSEKNIAAVKKVFRRLAARLHPDRNPKFCDEAKELWEELRIAKKALDLRSMERLEVHWQILKGEDIPATAEPRLKDLQNSLDDQMIELRESLEDLKTHPLWGRGGSEVPAEVEARIREDITEDIRFLRSEKRELEAEIARFRRTPPRRKSTARHTPKKKRPKKKTTKKKKTKKPGK